MAGVTFFNSKECSWKDIRVNIAGAPVIKITEIKYGSKMDKELLHGAGDSPIGTQKGNRDYEGQMTLMLGALNDLNAAAVAAGGKDCLDITFPIVVQYKAQGTRAVRTVTLVDVDIMKYEEGMSQGDKKSLVSLPFVYVDQIPG